ncbi:MAG: polysaccharide pyruvyl transferase family protein [Candidatus Falkowbacteria bacterium]|nr:polysaccharide pyruvyl transferase family protein [Candidatus Falkowbacteria bacterium]
MKKIKIAHIHVWDKDNKGDLAIVIAVQDALRCEFPNAKIIDFPIEVLKNYDAKKLGELNQADFIVFGGGGVFYRYFLPFNKRMISGLKSPLAIFGVGYIREVGARALLDKERDSIIQLVKKAKLVGVRENYTKKILVQWGLGSDKILVIGDPAVLLEERIPKDFPLTPGLKIGLNLNYSGWLGFGSWREDILNAYREVAEYFQKELGATVYYLKHHPGEDNIYPSLEIKDLQVVDLEPKEQKYVYGELDLVIGMMLHSCVLAFGALTPEINVAYDLRNRNFARFIGCEELVAELVDLKSGKLLASAKNLIDKKDFYSQRFSKKRLIIKKRQEEFVKLLNTLK